MISAWKPMALVAWHTLAIYLFLIVMFRLVGRRQLGQLNVIDLVIIVIMGSAVETAMVAGDTSLQAGLISATTLLIANRFIASVLSRSRRWRRLVSGDPILLVKEGQFIEEHLRRAAMTHEDVLEAMREREACDVSNVKFAVLETNGTITIIPNGAETHRIRYRDTPSSGINSMSPAG
jgi:uncharacterized membrane protein YcaP (DUF421 family)